MISCFSEYFHDFQIPLQVAEANDKLVLEDSIAVVLQCGTPSSAISHVGSLSKTSCRKNNKFC